MAIEINSTNQIYNPAYNDMTIIVISTNIADVNFKYIADIYIGSEIIRLSAEKHPVYDTGVFHFGRIVEDFVSQDISKATHGFQENTNSYISWYVKFGEQYGAENTIYEDVETSDTFYSWNAIFDFIPFQSYTQDPYILTSAGVNKLLTNKPATVEIRDNEDAWLYAAGFTNTITHAMVITFDSSGGIIQDVLISNPFSAGSFIRFGCGTSNLNLIASGITSGSQPLITPAVASYNISFYMMAFGAFQLSHLQTFKIKNPCTKNPTYRFHFLNKLGGYDSFTFIRGSKKTASISRSNFNANIGTSLSASAFGYSASARGVTNYDVKIKDKITVQSDWITEETNIWLEELITSPDVYLDDAVSGLIAVNINNSSYEFKQEATEKIFNLSIDFSYSYDRTRQRR